MDIGEPASSMGPSPADAPAPHFSQAATCQTATPPQAATIASDRMVAEPTPKADSSKSANQSTDRLAATEKPTSRTDNGGGLSQQQQQQQDCTRSEIQPPLSTSKAQAPGSTLEAPSGSGGGTCSSPDHETAGQASTDGPPVFACIARCAAGGCHCCHSVAPAMCKVVNRHATIIRLHHVSLGSAYTSLYR